MVPHNSVITNLTYADNIICSDMISLVFMYQYIFIYIDITQYIQ